MSAFLAGWLALSSVSVCLSVCLCDQQIVIALANCRFVCLYLSLYFDIHLSVRLSGLITLSTLIQVSGFLIVLNSSANRIIGTIYKCLHGKCIEQDDI